MTHSFPTRRSSYRHRQRPQRRHVEGFVDLALVERAVAEVGDRHRFFVQVAVREGEAGAERHLRPDDAVAAVEALLVAEHVHRAALRSEEHTSELQSLMRSSYAVFCLKKKKK